MESPCDATTRVSARILLFGSSYLWEIGSALLSLSLNFYSLPGTDDKKIARTENPYSFLSYYTCSYSFISLFFFSAFSLPPSLSPFSSPFLFTLPLHPVPPDLPFSRMSLSSIFRFLFISVRTMLTSPVFYPLIDGSRVNPPESG